MERSSGELTPGADVTPSKHLAIHFPIGIWRETVSTLKRSATTMVYRFLHGRPCFPLYPSLWSFINQKGALFPTSLRILYTVRGELVPAPTCPPEELSSLSPDRLRFPIGLVSEDKVDELLLRDDGEAGTDEFGVVPCDDPAEPLNAAAAAAGLQ
ncbi:uncharacterized protein BO87DRAFT_400988 [Aspergillus neoniger CBS 115656]|uniref:Uncharacterized protein n=1 Tax=Aspergillus neoniger (strain CBS 115656) TaxID=1448310 RepID=A0A318YBV7_ASPNB|nr:hypothetical protein BO87DRAFT_400988 [Aspergillus neoniger CBS 115656]PYH29833.1 hypothetical protein BO87DRAFT_400988 [Aspergillus neoniger CBS 115656]